MKRRRIKNYMWLVGLAILVSACASQAVEAPATAIEMISSPSVSLTPLAISDPPSETVQLKATITTIPLAQGGQGVGLVFIGETIPDGTVMAAGQAFHKTWTFRNGGARAWAVGFALVRTGSVPQTEHLGSPDSIPLVHAVQPGQEIEIGVDLTAPLHDGRYTIYYELRDEADQPVPNSQTWVSITVGNITTSGATSGNVSATLTGFDQNGQSATVRFCMTFPDGSRNWMVSAGSSSVVLVVDQVTIAASDGGGSQNCYEFNFPLNNIDPGQAAHISVSIQAVENAPNNLHDQCEAIKPGLQAQYPGIDFTCEGEHTFYSHLVLPVGLTSSAADQLIVDAITNKIYGPWVLSIR